jgi:hypothetical protein
MNMADRMAKAFAALDDDGRRFCLGVVEGEAEVVQARRAQQTPRPILRLIQCGPPAVTLTRKPRASVRAKRKESA